MSLFSNRIDRCMEYMQTEGISQLLVTSQPNIFYLTGQKINTGERMIVLLLELGKDPKLFLHEMFAGEVELPERVELVLYKDEMNPVALVGSCLSGKGWVGVDQNWPSSFLIDLIQEIPNLRVMKSSIVEQLREIKEENEINLLRQSARIAVAVMHQVIELQHFPATERQMAETIRSFFAEHQVYDLSFIPIVGFGENSANPHHQIGDTGLLPDQPIVLDFGGILQQYCSDITRTVFYGRKNKRFEEIYRIVKEAQEKAIAMVRPGTRFADIDLMIRREFAKWGYDRYFTHRTGHGLGLELHERPFIHQNNWNEMKKGMVFSIEPGIYLPGEFGVRIEDIVVVTDSGCEVLTLSPKELLYIEHYAV